MTESESETLKAPFPYFGGKSSVADLVWDRFGRVQNYVEPFFGSGATLLARPETLDGIRETVNDACGFVANFWRAVQAQPDLVAHHADWPVNECDLHARHSWLVRQRDTMQESLEGDPHWYDPKIAGWWCWGLCSWIGGGFCSGNGPWHSVIGDDGVARLVKSGSDGEGVTRQRPHVRDAGVNRKRPHLSDAGHGVNRKALDGVNRKLPHLSDAGHGVNRRSISLYDWFAALQSRLQRVRICCGDWSRVCTRSPTTLRGLTAVFLDPPYSAEANRNEKIYRIESTTVAHDVREWCLEHGDDPMLRIALCGYEGEHEMPDTWECHAWKTQGGYANLGDNQGHENAHRERIWFSPHCVRPVTGRSLFDE